MMRCGTPEEHKLYREVRDLQTTALYHQRMAKLKRVQAGELKRLLEEQIKKRRMDV